MNSLVKLFRLSGFPYKIVVALDASRMHSSKVIIVTLINKISAIIWPFILNKVYERTCHTPMNESSNFIC